MATLIEPLESRTLFSGTVLHAAVLTVTQVADQQAIAAAQGAVATARTARITTLASDRVNITTVRTSDNELIAGDLAEQRLDRGDASLEEADILKTRADRSQLVLDVRDAQATLRTDTVSTERTILADLKAVSAARIKYIYDVAHHL